MHPFIQKALMQSDLQQILGLRRLNSICTVTSGTAKMYMVLFEVDVAPALPREEEHATLTGNAADHATPTSSATEHITQAVDESSAATHGDAASAVGDDEARGHDDDVSASNGDTLGAEEHQAAPRQPRQDEEGEDAHVHPEQAVESNSRVQAFSETLSAWDDWYHRGPLLVHFDWYTYLAHVERCPKPKASSSGDSLASINTFQSKVIRIFKRPKNLLKSSTTMDAPLFLSFSLLNNTLILKNADRGQV